MLPDRIGNRYGSAGPQSSISCIDDDWRDT